VVEWGGAIGSDNSGMQREHMVAFQQIDGGQEEPLDLRLMESGPVAMFRKDAVLADTIALLERTGYAIAQADCRDCQTDQEVLWALGKALGFDRWPSPNLDGFNDDCWHLEVREQAGMAIVLRRFERVVVRSPEFARQVLDIFAWTSWNNLLYVRRLLFLVQSEDPWIQIGKVGGREPWWNPREWFNRDRE
jgi:hypothetical protein